jgi:hypothetical protein
VAKGQYKEATEAVALKDVETTKSYYKGLDKRQFTFRVESPKVNLHMAAKTNEEKWAWMTAIEKMIDRFMFPAKKNTERAAIRNTIIMSRATKQNFFKS